MLDKTRKIQLIERILGLKHKLKVNESGQTPLNHHELATLMAANWELEDEIQAIESFLTQSRQDVVKSRVIALIKSDGLLEKPPKAYDDAPAVEAAPLTKSPSKKKS